MGAGQGDIESIVRRWHIRSLTCPDHLIPEREIVRHLPELAFVFR